MEWKITINKEKKFVEVITSGIAGRDSSLDMAKKIAHTMRTNRMTRVLIDHSNISSVTGDKVDVYFRPKIFKIIGVIFKIKIAEVIKLEHMDHFRFFETVCVNRGYRVSIFQEKGEALSWLLE